LGIVPENSNPEEASAAGEAIPVLAPAKQATRIPRNAFEETVPVKKGAVGDRNDGLCRRQDPSVYPG
jgi:hypothetical protein